MSIVLCLSIKKVELLARNGLYASLWNRQTGSFLDEGGEE